MPLTTISKSHFKAKALEYMRLVEQSQQPLIITDMGEPVVQLTPYVAEAAHSNKKLYALRGTLDTYKDPTAPVSTTDWETLR